MKWIKFTVVWRTGWILHLDTPRNKPQYYQNSLLIPSDHFLFGVYHNLMHNENQLLPSEEKRGVTAKQSKSSPRQQISSLGPHLLSHLKKEDLIIFLLSENKVSTGTTCYPRLPIFSVYICILRLLIFRCIPIWQKKKMYILFVIEAGFRIQNDD